MKKIKAIVFDWGGVLAKNVFEELMDYYAARLRVAPAELKAVYEKYYHKFLVNKIKERDFWLRICQELGRPPVAAASLMNDGFNHAYRPHYDVIELINRLRRKGYLIGLLSDAEVPAVRFFFAQDHLLFDAVVFSSMVGSEKPDRSIYESLLKELGTRPEETVFFDDFPENVAGANELGIKAYRFTNVAQAERDLRRLGVHF